MTATATILALTPVALGFSHGSIIAAELATVVIGGLFSSTFLTLIVIPVLYSLVDGGKDGFWKRFGGGTDADTDAEASAPTRRDCGADAHRRLTALWPDISQTSIRRPGRHAWPGLRR